MTFTLPKEKILEAFLKCFDLIFQLKADGTFVACHAGKGSGFLRPKEGCAGRSLAEVFPDTFASEAVFYLEKAFEIGETQRFYYQADFSGCTRYFEVTLEPVDGENCLAFVRDISELIETEKELQESKNFLENVFHALRDGLSILDRELNIVKVNYWMRLKYLHALPLEGKKCYQAYQQRDYICPKCPSVRTLKTGQPAEEIVPYITPKGQEGWLELSTFPLRNEEGRLIGVIEHVKDVTQRIEAQKQRKLLVQAVEQCCEAILVTDRIGRMVYVNPAFEEITGYRREEALNQRPEFLKRANPSIYRDIWRELRQGKNWQGELELFRRDGSKVWVELSVSPVRDEDHRITNFVAVLHDITEKVQLEAQLRRSQKLESIGRLAGGIAHDFNNILTAVMGYTELLANRVSSDPVSRRYIENIFAFLKRAKTLSHRLLSFVRSGSGKREVFDLTHLVSEFLGMVKRLVPEQIEFRVSLPKEELPIEADPSEVEQIILNLVMNATEAMPEGGRLELELKKEAPRFLEEEKDFVKIKVSDTGCGIEREDLDYIFDPFFTTKETGSGLGLFVVFSTVRRLKGYITVDSTPGLGTTFEIFLPLAKRPVPQKSRAQAASFALSKDFKGLTILLVEDEAPVRQFLKEVLSLTGAEVMEAGDCQEALSLLKKNWPKIDLLLTDLVIPEGDGALLAEEARKLNPQIRIIFISGYPKGKQVEKLPGHFLAKPFTTRELLEMIEKVRLNDG